MTSLQFYNNCTIATMTHDQPDYGLISDAAFLVEDGRIAWVGPAHQAPSGLQDVQTLSLEGRLVTPALIDCHTHLVFGGNRASEFEMRQNGATYEQISNRGGGIKSTVAATRAASFDELVTTALRRLDCLIREGVAVVEVKSGYGLTIEDEIRLLRVARRLEQLRPVKIMTTWLAAHAVPADYLGRPDAYIDNVAIPGLEQAAQEKLVDAVDGFCETIAFTPAQIDRVFQAARALDLPVKLHAEQLTDQGGTRLAAGYSALSADHLEFLPESDAAVLAASGTVAVLLPGAFYTLKETKTPPVEAFRAAGVDMAVATDCNPGTSPLSSLLTAMNLACIQFSLTPEEALAGTTRHAAKALGLSGDYGEITEGALAELAVWNVEHPAELSYWVGGNPLYQRIMQQD